MEQGMRGWAVGVVGPGSAGCMQMPTVGCELDCSRTIQNRARCPTYADPLLALFTVLLTMAGRDTGH